MEPIISVLRDIRGNIVQVEIRETMTQEEFVRRFGEDKLREVRNTLKSGVGKVVLGMGGSKESE